MKGLRALRQELRKSRRRVNYLMERGRIEPEGLNLALELEDTLSHCEAITRDLQRYERGNTHGDKTNT